MSQQIIDIRRIKSNMNVRIKLKTDTIERCKQFNPVLYESEPAIIKCENGDRYLVIGDGVHNIMDLDCQLVGIFLILGILIPKIYLNI